MRNSVCENVVCAKSSYVKTVFCVYFSTIIISHIRMRSECVTILEWKVNTSQWYEEYSTSKRLLCLPSEFLCKVTGLLDQMSEFTLRNSMNRNKVGQKYQLFFFTLYGIPEGRKRLSWFVDGKSC